MKENYKQIDTLHKEYLNIQYKMEDLAISGIKELFNQLSIKEYNLINNDIFVSLFSNGDDNQVLCESLIIDKNNNLCVCTDDNCEYNAEDLHGDVLYYLFVSLHDYINE